MRKRSLLVLFSMVLLVGIFYSSTPTQAKTTEKQYKQQIENLKKQVKAKDSSIKAKDKEIKSLKGKVSDRDKKIKSKDSSIKSKDAEIKSLKSKVTTKDKDIATKKKQIADRDKTIAAKNKEIATLKGNVFTPISSQLVYQDKSKVGNIKIGNGTVPTLVTYKGVYYSPVNALASMMSLGVKYDNKQKKLFVGEGTDGVIMSDVIKPYSGSNYVNEDYQGETLELSGLNYSKGYYFDDFSTNFNLSKKYSILEGYIGLADKYNKYDTKLGIYGDGKLLYSATFLKGDIQRKVNITVKNINRLEFRVESINTNNHSDIVFGNPKLK